VYVIVASLAVTWAVPPAVLSVRDANGLAAGERQGSILAAVDVRQQGAVGPPLSGSLQATVRG
jgi:hypothetical protein